MEHKLAQRICKQTVSDAKKHFEEHVTNNIKFINKEFFKYIRSRKPAREAVEPLDDKGVKGVLKEDREIAEKLNEFFASVFTAEDTGQMPVPKLMF